MRRVRGLIAAARPRRIAELQALDEQVRRPLALSTRVGFVGTAGGVGCSSVAGLAASVLARRRTGRVLAVNASGGERSLLWHAGLLSEATSTIEQDSRRASAGTAREALDGLVAAPSGLRGIDLTRQTQTDDSRWWEAVAPSSRFFDFVVTDWGARDVASLGHVVAASSLLAIVMTPDRVAMQHAVDLAAAAYAANLPAVGVLVPARGRAGWGVGEAVRAFPIPVHRFPRDRAHGAARPVASTRLLDSTNLAAIRLAAGLVSAAAARRSDAAAGRRRPEEKVKA
ncbi:hypothetical protein [Pseudactinotalea suaedae]|uniref:hypothetical protein n=1 Tax=Pseudactinotalea suaedae TaxID=1524924 RepID=UPI0012E2908B|nr:hypothetical protein [Pseudactinotalea suaedae]